MGVLQIYNKLLCVLLIEITFQYDSFVVVPVRMLMLNAFKKIFLNKNMDHWYIALQQCHASHLAIISVVTLLHPRGDIMQWGSFNNLTTKFSLLLKFQDVSL